MKRKGKLNIVTLGCSKNVVDSEYLIRQLEEEGWEVLHDSNTLDVDVAIINTCGFIGDAKEESIDTIMDFVAAKQAGMVKRIFVMGCLSQRYRKELTEEIPEVDGFFGVYEHADILNALSTPYRNRLSLHRSLTTPSHYAYLKVSEGCSWGCAFCAIPLIKGKHRSRSMDDLMREAELLAQKGTKELILIAQDLTYYGMDLYNRRAIAELVEQLSEISGIEWIRLHYAYPNNFPDSLIEVMADNPKVCNYLDIPLQHINSDVLKAMRRGINRKETIELLRRIKGRIPDLAIRTTFLVGYPNETPKAFRELLDFVQEQQFDRVGVFAYSEEEGTHAAQTLPDTIAPQEKERRKDALMELQSQISLNNNRKHIGKSYRVIVDSVEDNLLICRSQFDSPEVDQEVLVTPMGHKTYIPGDFITARIADAQEFDLIARAE